MPFKKSSYTSALTQHTVSGAIYSNTVWFQQLPWWVLFSSFPKEESGSMTMNLLQMPQTLASESDQYNITPLSRPFWVCLKKGIFKEIVIRYDSLKCLFLGNTLLLGKALRQHHEIGSVVLTPIEFCLVPLPSGFLLKDKLYLCGISRTQYSISLGMKWSSDS